MLFNSFQFAIFLPVVFILYWTLPCKYRWLLILIASYWFYISWNFRYSMLILAVTLVSYLAAVMIEKQDSDCGRRWMLSGTVIICLGILFFFKYFNFVSKSIASVLSLFTMPVSPYNLNLILPVGISFYIFQTLSYVVDVYNGEMEAERHFGKYAAFVSFFPQLVAGPIERASKLLPQIKTEHRFDCTFASYGLKQMAWGYFKKIVISDSISQYIGKVFDSPQRFQGFSLMFTAVMFSIQIYCDFSGYSDIALGVAKLFGIKLTANFRSPYFSRSLGEFWGRWHVSLSTWFRDYVYIPLGGNRVGKLRNAKNLMVTFLASGLWHGADWTFIIWGGMHGLALSAEKIFIPEKCQRAAGLAKVLNIVVVFCFCTFAWVFFASDSLKDAIYIVKHVFDGILDPVNYLRDGLLAIGMDEASLVFLVLSILLLLVFDYVSMKKDVIAVISSKKVIVRWCLYIIFVLWMILNIPVTDTTEFIYFQF